MCWLGIAYWASSRIFEEKKTMRRHTVTDITVAVLSFRIA